MALTLKTYKYKALYNIPEFFAVCRKNFRYTLTTFVFYAIIGIRNFCGTPHLYLVGGALTMEIMRSQYLNQLIKKMHNGRVKIITGISAGMKSTTYKLIKQISFEIWV